MILSAEQGRFQIDGKDRFLLADTVWSALGSSSQDEWAFYLHRRAQQGFNAALLSVLPILHDRSLRQSTLGPFDEDTVVAGAWRFDSRFFATLRQRLDMASEAGIVCGLVLLWVNYVEGSWGAARTPGFVMPERARAEYLSALSGVVHDRECLLVVSGDAGLTSPTEVESYRQFAELTKEIWPESLVAFHSAPTAVLPPELDKLASVLVFQSGHHGESPSLARELAGRYRGIAGGRPVMNAEPAYEAHRVGGGVGRFGRVTVRRRIWESVVGGASAGVTYGAHGLWSWHRNGDPFTSVHFSGQPLDWREALLLPGSDDAAVCREIMEQEGMGRFGPCPDDLTVTDEGWGASDVVVGADPDSRMAAVYLPNGGPVTLRANGSLTLRRVVDLTTGKDVRTSCLAQSGGTFVIDPPGNVPEALLVLDMS
jgi:Protein of unknown function (DUF4038)